MPQGELLLDRYFCPPAPYCCYPQVVPLAVNVFGSRVRYNLAALLPMHASKPGQNYRCRKELKMPGCHTNEQQQLKPVPASSDGFRLDGFWLYCPNVSDSHSKIAAPPALKTARRLDLCSTGWPQAPRAFDQILHTRLSRAIQTALGLLLPEYPHQLPCVHYPINTPGSACTDKGARRNLKQQLSGQMLLTCKISFNQGTAAHSRTIILFPYPYVLVWPALD